MAANDAVVDVGVAHVVITIVVAEALAAEAGVLSGEM